MRRSCSALAFSLLALVAASAPARLAGQQPQPRRVDDAALRKAGAGDEWLTYGLDQSEARFSPLTDINASNVARLGLAWAFDAGSGGGGQEATPLVWNNTIYTVTNWSVVFAVDARTGKERWRWDPEVNQDAVRPKICCGAVKPFGFSSSGHLVFGDSNHDGHNELILRSLTPENNDLTQVFETQALGQYDLVAEIPGVIPMAIGDIDQDGWADLVVQRANCVAVYESPSETAYPAATTLAAGASRWPPILHSPLE
jgi:hypothetical protein